MTNKSFRVERCKSSKRSTCLAELRHPSGVPLHDGDGLAALRHEPADDAARRGVGVLGEVVGADYGVCVVVLVVFATLGGNSKGTRVVGT